jgi:mannose-1-phosphate guanylyltransferase
MKALLLAAGHGTRLRPRTDTMPKCLVPIGGRPLLDHWLAMLREGGVQPILLNLHAFAGQVRDYLAASGYGDIVTTAWEEKLLGTAGTILRNRSFFDGEPFMLIHADNLSLFDVAAFIGRHGERPPHCEMTMMTFESPSPETCGIVELDDSGVVQAFHEKVSAPPGNLANGAVYILEPGIISALEGMGKDVIDFSTEVLPRYIGRIFTFHNDRYHRDIGTPESYAAALREFKGKDVI